MTRRDFLFCTAAGAVAAAGAPLLALAGDAPRKSADIAEVFGAVGKLLDKSPFNRVAKTETRVYDAPLFGVSSAEDPLYRKLQEVVGKDHYLPKDWYSGAKSVISYFLPYSEPVSKANRGKEDAPDLWVEANHQGAKARELVRRFLKKTLSDLNVGVFVPFHDSHYRNKKLIADWSERHVAFISGLGTFGLHKNLITAHGSSGRFDSIITDFEFPPTKRAYEGTYDYCIKCYACVGRCPVGAITEKGKNILVCARRCLAGKIDPEQAVCGKCLTGVPCENRIPPAKGAAPWSAPADGR